ncbi:MAG: manganese efflux pump [bacterium]
MLAPFELALLAIGLGCDAFAVAVVAGIRGITARRLFRVSWHMGFFQFLMPILGYTLGVGLLHIIGRITRVAGSVLLAGIAGHMLIEGWRSARESEPRKPADLSRGWLLVGVSVATSIDALIVGVWLGMTGGELLLQSSIIGLTAGTMACGGMLLGRALSHRIGRVAHFLGSAALFALAVRIFFE